MHVVFILSDRYYSSPACLNEMGAAWVTKKEYTSILLPGFDFSQIRGAISADQLSIKLDSDEDELKQRLNELKDTLTEVFEISKLPDIRWEEFRNDFIESIKSIQRKKEIEMANKNQPLFSVEVDAVNGLLPGIVDEESDTFNNSCHKNIQLSIEVLNDRIAKNVIIFDKLIRATLKKGDKYKVIVAYEDSEDAKKYPSRITKILLHSEYEDTNGLPNWFNICYQDEEGHNMVQSMKLNFFDIDPYYDFDGDPWMT